MSGGVAIIINPFALHRVGGVGDALTWRYPASTACPGEDAGFQDVNRAQTARLLRLLLTVACGGLFFTLPRFVPISMLL